MKSPSRDTPPRRFHEFMRWSSPNSKNYAYTTGDGHLCLKIDGESYYFTRRRVSKKARKK